MSPHKCCLLPKLTQLLATGKVTLMLPFSCHRLGLLDLAIEEMEEGHGNDPDTEARRMTDLYDAYLRRRMDDSCCYICRDPGPVLQCISCERQYHTLCTQIPAVALEAFPEGRWQCPCCAQVQSVLRPVPADSPEGDAEGRGEEQVERMGLTPDWIIAAAAFQVFQLPRPSADRPYIRGLLDPCTNSKVAPNIPAERLYDKQDNGLKLENSWAGQYVLLNPDFSAQVQWRFVNRAIDEVENDSVPAVILIVRNSTDTAYYQRLRPYPRVHLRRTSARFKDYSKSPIGFGIAVFCVAKHSCTELFGRFIDAFEPMGEPNLPIDKLFLASPACAALLERLRKFAAEHHRDHWVQCSECGKWRILDFSAASQVSEEADWRCAMLRPPYSSCDTLPTTREMMGGKYAARGLEDVGATWGGYAVAQGQQGGAPEVQAHPMQVGYTSLTTAPSPPPPSMVPFIPPESDHMHQSELRPSSHVPGNSLCSASSGVVLSRSDSIEPAALQAAVDTLPLNSIIDSIIAQGEETSDECEVVTALEMARQARIAANRAYFQQLGLNSAGCGGEGPNAAPLAYDDPAVMAAAREISKRVALETCRQQEEEARKRYAAVSRRCRQEAARLLAALQEVRNTEAVAKKAWEAAQSAAAELTAELSHRTV